MTMTHGGGDGDGDVYVCECVFCGDGDDDVKSRRVLTFSKEGYIGFINEIEKYFGVGCRTK